MSKKDLARPTRRYLADKISILVLLSVGFFGTCIGVLDTLGDPEKLVRYIPFLHYVKNTSSLVLVIVSLLAIAVGLERYASFDEIREVVQQARSETESSWRGIESELLEIHRTLTIKIPVKTFWGRESLYEEILRTLRNCKGTETIRSTALIGHSHEGTDEHVRYLEALARKINDSKQGSFGMLYRVVITSSQSESFETSINRRRAIFAKNGVEDRLDMRESKDLWGLDVLIVDKDHLFIAFPMQKGSYALRLGIKISDKELVENVTRWYEECVWQAANPIVPQAKPGTSS